MPASARPNGARRTRLKSTYTHDHHQEHEIIKLHRIFEIEGLHAGDGELGAHGDVDAVRAPPNLVSWKTE